jgi:phospholipase D1/2
MAKVKKRRKPAWGKLAAIAVVVAALAVAWRYTPLSELITAQRINDWARAVRGVPWAPAVVILAYIPAAFVLFPRPVLTLLTVIAFGPYLGFLYAMTGILLSALVTYYAGRLLDAKRVERLAGRYFERISEVLRHHGLLAVFAMRVVPVAPFLVESIVAGAARTNVWHYTAGTFLGMLPGVAAETVFGTQITAALEDLSEVNWWLIGAAALALAAVTWAVGRWFARKFPAAPQGSPR